MELAALQEAVPEITALGATMVAVSPQLPEHSREVVEKHRLTFEILRDQGNGVAQMFGLVFKLPDDLRQVYQRFGIDLPAVNGDDSWTLPMSARFVADPAGIIRAAAVDPDYTRRPDPAETIAVLHALRAEGSRLRDGSGDRGSI